jgi:hypothetical protein
MQVLERPQQRDPVVAWESRPHTSLHATTLTGLSQRHSSGYSHSPSASVRVTCAGGDDYTGAFRGTGPDGSGRTWEACVLVLGVSGVGLSRLEECLGSGMAVHAGEARPFMPGLAADADADPEQHPAFAQSHAAPRLEASYVEAAAQRATHSWCTSVARRADFDVLWARSGRL